MNRVLFSLVWVLTFILSIFGIVYISVPRIIPFEINPFITKILLLNICIVYFVITIVKFFSLFKRKKEYEIDTAEGKIIVTTSSIKTFVLKTLETDNDISIGSIDSYYKGNKFNLKIELELLKNTNLSEKIKELQEKLQASGKKILGIEISSIVVKVTKIKFKNIEVN